MSEVKDALVVMAAAERDGLDAFNEAVNKLREVTLKHKKSTPQLRVVPSVGSWSEAETRQAFLRKEFLLDQWRPELRQADEPALDPSRDASLLHLLRVGRPAVEVKAKFLTARFQREAGALEVRRSELRLRLNQLHARLSEAQTLVDGAEYDRNTLQIHNHLGPDLYI
jgi:hypothetical protein